MVDWDVSGGGDVGEPDFLFKPSEVQADFRIPIPDSIFGILEMNDSGDIWWHFHEKGYVLLSTSRADSDRYRVPLDQGRISSRSLYNPTAVPQQIKDETELGDLENGDVVYFYTDRGLISGEDGYVFLLTESQWFGLLQQKGFDGLDVTAASLEWIGPLSDIEELEKEIQEIEQRLEDIETVREVKGSLGDDLAEERTELKQELGEKKQILQNLKAQSEEYDVEMSDDISQEFR